MGIEYHKKEIISYTPFCSVSVRSSHPNIYFSTPIHAVSLTSKTSSTDKALFFSIWNGKLVPKNAEVQFFCASSYCVSEINIILKLAVM